MYRLRFAEEEATDLSLTEIFRSMVPGLSEYMVLENYQAILSKKKIVRGPIYYLINLAGDDDKLELTLGRKSTSDI